MAPRACRDYCILLIAVFSIADLLGHLHAESSAVPRVAIAQLPTLSGPVWPGDFNGDGTFGVGRSVAAYDSATFALAADFDGDGTRDLAIGAEPNILDIYPGRKDLTFGAKASFVTGAFPQGGAAADLNGDGKKDIV